MRLRYETGVAALIQFVVTIALSFLNGAASIIGGCLHGFTADCVTNGLSSLILIILIAVALGFLLALGYTAQERRSSNLARLLMGFEGFAALIFLFDAKQSPGIFDRITNFVYLLLAVWVIILAWRLSRAHGGRIVHARARRRPTKQA